MNDCVNVDVRDALPDFINHRMSELDAVTISEHIASCADCRAEAAILSDVMKSRPIAPAMNLDRLSAAIPAYAPLRPRSVGFPTRRTWALAAAAAFVAIGGWAITSRTTETSAPAVAVSVPPVTTKVADVPSIPKAVEKVTNTSKEVQVASLSLVGSTDDLSDSDLESLVAALDGIEAVPSAEPGSVTTTVDDIDGTDDQ